MTTLVPSLSIVVANEVAKNVISEAMVDTSEGLKETSKGWGPHVQFTPEGKASVGKHATKYGIASIVWYFKHTFSNLKMKESCVHIWRNKYLDELSKRKHTDEIYVNELSTDKRTGRRLILGEEVDKQVQSHVLDL